jgi:hypothetical protein
MDKTRLKGPCCRDWKLPGTFLRKLRGIYIIMYINSRALLAKGPEWMESGESKRFKGLLQVWQDTRKGSRVTEKNTGLSAKSPHVISYLWPADRGTGRLQIAGAPGGLWLG